MTNYVELNQKINEKMEKVYKKIRRKERLKDIGKIAAAAIVWTIVVMKTK